MRWLNKLVLRWVLRDVWKTLSDNERLLLMRDCKFGDVQIQTWYRRTWSALPKSVRSQLVEQTLLVIEEHERSNYLL